MTEPTFGASLRALHEGRITFTEFARATHTRWKRIALYIRSRWKQPIWHGIDDVIQELLEGAWRCIPKFDPTRGVTLERFVIFNSVDRAKKACHRARGANLSGSADRNPSHLETTMSSYDEETERFVAELLQDEPTQFRHIERIEAIERARKHCETMVEELAVSSLVQTQSVIASADALYSNYHTRLACRFSNEDQALRVVSQAIADVADRMHPEGERTS